MTGSGAPGRPGWIGVAIASLGVVLIVGVSIHLSLANASQLDVLADWLVVQAAWDPEASVGAPLGELGQRYQVDYQPVLDPSQVSHPRTPGALFLMSPLALVPADTLPILWAGVSAALLSLLVLGGGRLIGLGWGQSGLALLLVGIAPSALASFAFGTQSILVAVLLAVAPLLVLRGWEGLGGSVLGVAIVLKLFPLLLLPAFVRFPRAVVSCVVTCVLLSGMGWLLPGVGLWDAAGSVAAAPEVWFSLPHNGSLAAVLAHGLGLSRLWATAVGAAFALVVLVGLLSQRAAGDPDRVLGVYLGLIPVALLAMPNSWLHYDLALIPLAFFLAYGMEPPRWLGFGLLVLAVLGYGFLLLGLQMSWVSALSRLSAVIWVAILFQTNSNNRGFLNRTIQT